MSTLEVVRAEIAAHDDARPRSQQTATGASQLFGCRAESLLRLSGAPESDPREKWQALVGTAIHSMFEHAAPNHVLTEHRAVYRGVPCTIDRYDPETKTLTDFKSKDDSEAIEKVKRFGVPRRQQAQVQIGAAALRAEGYEVEAVELLFVPRAGSLDDAYLWSSPFNQRLADEAADWAAEQAERAEGFVFSDRSQLDGLRDEPSWFCHAYCPFATVCRGEEEPGPALDEHVAAVAAEYFDAKSRESEAKNALKRLRSELMGVSGEAGGLRVSWSGGNTSTTTEVDAEKALAEYEALIGALPTREVTSTSSLRLTVTKAKPKAAKSKKAT